MALPLVGLAFTRSPGLIAGLTLAFTLPWLLCALPAGAIVDRLDRRHAMIAANLLRGTLMAALALVLLLDSGSVAALYVVAFSVGVAETVYDTSAQALVPQVVAREQLSRANSRLFAAELTANQFVGPPLASVLVLAGGAATFAAASAAWLAAVAAVLLVRGRFRVRRAVRTTLRSDIVEGLRFLWRHRVLRRFALMVATYNLCSNATFSVLVLYAVGPGSPMGLTPPAFGVLLAMQAIGSVLGTIVAERIERRVGRVRTLVGGFLISAPVIGVPALSTNVLVIGTVFVVGAAALVVANVVQLSLRQRITPDRLRGRMSSAFRLTAWGTMPVGAALGGLLGEWWGLRAVFAVMGVLALAVALGLVGVTDRLLDDAEREGDDRS